MSELLSAPWQAQVALAVLFAALAISVVTDLRKRLILNLVTYPALLIILVMFFWLGGWPLDAEALVGILICAGPMLLGLILRKAMGAGDVKLMALSGAVSGAAAGWRFAITVLLYVAIAGGVQAVIWLVGAKLRHQERPKYVPYGVAIAAGTLAAFLFGGAFI